MKSVCIDARMRESSGIGTVIRNLQENLPAIAGPDWSFPAITPQEGPPIYSLKEQRQMPALLRQSGADLYHIPHYNVPLACLDRCVVTVHDAIHLLFPQYLPSKAAWLYAQFFYRVALPRVRHILADSECTRRDLIRLTRIPESRITVAHLAVSSDFSIEARRAIPVVRERWWLPERYFLYVGNLKEFKNVERLVDAYDLLQKTVPGCPALVLAGRNFIPGFDQLLRDRVNVVHLPSVGRGDLPGLYAGAFAFLFPSLYEGFGLPPLEAMACGTPVLCSNRGSLPEVTGEAALRVDPLDILAIKRGMQRLLEDNALRESLSQKGLQRAALFSWPRMAKTTFEIYKKCLP